MIGMLEPRVNQIPADERNYSKKGLFRNLILSRVVRRVPSNAPAVMRHCAGRPLAQRKPAFKPSTVTTGEPDIFRLIASR